MRTTLTIDDDLVQEMKQRAHEMGSPFKDVVNQALRAGLKDMDRPKKARPYRCRAYALGYPPMADLDRALDLAERIENEEIARKLALRK